MTKKTIENIICQCIEKLYKKDKYLFDCMVCERSLMFRLGHYLQLRNEFRNYFVDCEFNKKGSKENGSDFKVMKYDENGELKRIYVDIIIHTRKPEEDESNFICIEIKRTKKGITKDEKRLKIMTRQKSAFEHNGNTYIFGYKYGFLLYLPKIKEKMEIDTFVDGKKIPFYGSDYCNNDSI
jgi:hypothetical protein